MGFINNFDIFLYFFKIKLTTNNKEKTEMKNKIVLAVVGVLFALFASVVFMNAKSAIHEIVALLSAIITALCLIGYAVLNEIEMAGVAILKELRKEDK